MLHSTFVQPQYNDRCFADIPPTVSHWLTGGGTPALSPEIVGDLPDRFDTVIVMLIDAFGWHQFKQYADDYPFLQQFQQEGVVAQLTSQFPSTTTAHVTCLHTGLPVAQAGLYEWFIYEPQIDGIIAPLLFSHFADNERDTLKNSPLKPEMLYPQPSIYETLKRQGVTSYLLQHRNYAHSTYSNVVCREAKMIPYNTLSEALVNLRFILQEPTSPKYIVFYFDAIDTLSHIYGPSSPHVAAEIDTLLRTLERFFPHDTLRQSNGNSLLLLTADHGQVDIDPQQTIYLNRTPRLNRISNDIRRNRQGALIVPSGSPRNMFLHIKPAQVAAAQAYLADGLQGRAAVYQVADLVEQGIFGPLPPSERFWARIGNLVIAPFGSETVWWYEKDRSEITMHGLHGGLSPQEMDIPLLLRAI